MQRVPLQRSKDANLTNALILLNRQHAGTDSEVATKADQTALDALSDVVDGKQDAISDLDEIRAGAALGSTAVQSIPSNVSAFANDAGYLTIDNLDLGTWSAE